MNTDNYFDNISEIDKSFTHVSIPDQLIASLENDNSGNKEDLVASLENNNSSDEEDSETDSELLINENTEHENENEILQTEHKNEKKYSCISQKSCPVLQKFDPIIIQSQLFIYSHYICYKCYEKFDGHFYKHSETG
ncbi:hypothetical protein Glove_402g93 [Diversispora epigaea]|uniref:Uncharacterized protein n=1 Tax=Diversispora epigaea TaxID=1348612 RepID=A0A397H3X5_9GLOM|nr:hypothetical protein Glove_402g93 [Diversispora epigaea]